MGLWVDIGPERRCIEEPVWETINTNMWWRGVSKTVYDAHLQTGEG